MHNKPSSGKKFAEDLLDQNFHQNHSSSGFDSSLNCRISSQKTYEKPGENSLTGERLAEENQKASLNSSNRSQENREKDFVKKINKPPVDRYESDEIELRDETDYDSVEEEKNEEKDLLEVPKKTSESEDKESPVIDFDDQSDDCAFKSLEGQATEVSRLGIVPKTQLKFN